MKLRLSIIVGFVVAAGTASAQQVAPSAVRSPVPSYASAAGLAWTFGPVKPHLSDAAVRTAWGLALGAAFMGAGLGIEALNHVQCRGTGTCFGGNPVQAGIGFAFLGTLVGTTAPVLHTKCTRPGRAMLGMLGAVLGATAASLIIDERLFNARTGDPATWRTMGSGLVGMGAGAGIATAIC